MDIEELKKSREAWYTAYFDGDTDVLKDIELVSFTIESPSGVQSRKSQIDSIISKVATGDWFPDGGSRSDRNVNIENRGTMCIVKGVGHITSGQRSLPLTEFCEHWSWDGESWKVSKLTYTSASNN